MPWSLVHLHPTVAPSLPQAATLIKSEAINLPFAAAACVAVHEDVRDLPLCALQSHLQKAQSAALEKTLNRQQYRMLKSTLNDARVWIQHA